MSARFSHRLQILSEGDNKACLQQIQHGIEKEGLRVTPDLQLSQIQHPRALGSTLTHPYITTDYSEALLEFITPVYLNPEDALNFLSELHTEALNKLPEGEFIWATSMPPVLQGDDLIPIATYGDSNIGQMKYVYRQGLAHRYGKAMQTIAGIHYNFSLPEQFWEIIRKADGDSSDLSAQDYQSASYFALIRNFRRYAWLLSYLFGSSPAVDASFLEGNDQHGLDRLDDQTWYLPWATSLRMSDLGYTSDAQSSLAICYNTLDNYVESLWSAIHTPYPDYEKIGVKGSDGQYRQLNTNLLQIENEYYSTIRPKRVTQSGEKPVVALKERGVEYIEVRCLDINPLMPLGINAAQARFLDTFLLFCALEDSPEISDDECDIIASNFGLSVREGRKPDLQLHDGSRPRGLTEWGAELLERMQPIAELLDNVSGTSLYQESLSSEGKKLNDVSLTPSAIILKVLEGGQSFRGYSAQQSRIQDDKLRSQKLDSERQGYFDDIAERSLHDLADKEMSDTVDFATFLHEYFTSEEIKA
ncbi:glutamate--cysteine ligase [Parendozoicomonas haliclonae]|uniref:glutamate--cysteine ligase n=1 Tax=Parendozoicomonas haliclonae TaxID=1960125 RepID=UPI001F60CABA|nr:glutamate--cysteine ligase [Parendozoicomonas haliclonae]